MLFSQSRRGRSHGKQVYIRPSLEALEDRITPTGPGFVGAPGMEGAAASMSPSSSPTFTFSPAGRFIIQSGQSFINLSVTLTQPGSATPLTTGAVTFTVTNSSGGVVGAPVTANVSTSGQAAATYNLPTNLPIGPYTITAVYNDTGSSYDGSSGSELLTVVLPPSPAVQIPTSSNGLTGSPSFTPAPNLYQAATTLFIDGAELVLDSMLHRATDAVQANIDANMSYAGTFGNVFELAGEMAAYHAMQNQQL